MGSLGDHEAKIQPVKRTSTLECSDTETYSFDIQSSPPSIPGTLPFVDTLPLEDGFETQVLNLGDETQILDHPDDVENTGTQLLGDFDNEEVDADGEGTDRTEVLGDMEELSDDDSAKRVGSCLARLENELYSTISRQDNKGFKAESDALLSERHSSELDISTAGLPDEGTPKSKLGSAARNFTSVRAAALRASGLAARNMALKGTNIKQCSMQTDNQYPKQHTFEDNVTPVVRDSSAFEKEVDQEDFLGEYNEQKNGLKNENKCKVGSSTVRRLFMDDSLAEIEGPKNYTDDADGGADVYELPACGNEMAGLSYIDSQEPGDLSQDNALDCVDRFLKLNVTDFDKEVDIGKSTGGKSKPVSSAKGTQKLAKKNNLRSTAGERGIFDWDDNCEDEGGGEFFTRKKETFFDNGGPRQRSFTQPSKLRLLDSKGSGAAKESRDKDEQLGIYRKIKGLVNTDSVLVLPNSKRSDKMAKAIQTISKKNLTKEFDEQLKIGSSDELEATVTHKDIPDMLNVGVDTQIAAEAMEALCFGLDVADHDKGDINQGTKNMHEYSSRRSKKKRAQSKRDVPQKRSSVSRVSSRNSKQTNGISPKLSKEPNVSSHKQSKDGEWSKRSSLSGSGVCTRSSKQIKGIGTNLSKDQIVLSWKQAKDVRKKCDTELVKTQRKKAKSNAEGCFATNSTENIDQVPSVVIEQIEEARSPKRKNIDEVDDAITSVKKRRLPEQVGTITPIARRTRQRRVTNQLRAGTVLKTNSVSHSVDLGMKRTTRSSVCAGPVFSSSDRQSKGSLFHHNVDKVSSGDADLEYNSEVSNVLSKDVVGSLASKRSNRQSDASTRSMGEEGTGRNASLEVSPVGICKPSGSASTTPVNCITPISDASPICMGDEYKKQSCRKNLSRSFLVKEINSLISSGPEPTSIIKDSRRRRDMANVQVLFSHHLDEDIIKQQKKILSRLGASVASSISEATHFVTDKFVRTRNMLEAIASGKPVVTHLWLDSCGQASCFIDERNYILRDAKKEKEFGFSLPVSLAHACQHPLLQGQKVLITRNTKPGKEILVSLVRAVNGLAVERIGRSAFKDDKIPDDLLVLSCEEDYDICVPFLEKGAAVYSSELLLNGIVKQKLEYGRHRLFEDHVKTTRSTVWLKKQASNQYLPVTKRK